VISDALLITIITAAASILAAYITVRVRRKKPRSEYIDTAFEAYEAIMKRQDEEIQRKDVIIANLTVELSKAKRRR